MTLVCEDGNLRLIEVLLLLESMMRSMPTTVWYKFGRSTLVIKLSYCSVCMRFWSWCSGKILKLYCRSDPGSRRRTMVACRMKARYIYTYVGLTTMIWEIQQMNSKSNVCICICKIWMQIQIQMQMHHHHHFVFLILWLFDGRRQWISCLPRQIEVFVIQIGYLHSQIWRLRKPLCLFYAGTLNIKC